MIDLHCHLCFACDDGPHDAAEARDLAQALSDAGVTEVACTPHVRSDKGWMNTQKEQPGLHQALHDMLDDAQSPLTVHRGAEHYLDEVLMAGPFDEVCVPYAQSKTILLELPYHGAPPHFMDQLFALRRAGYHLLLAHLERFPYVVDDEDALSRIVDSGYLIQVNLGSLSGGYTRAHKKAARKLIERGLVHVAAGDCHRAKDVTKFLQKGRKVLEKMVGEDGAQRLLVDNPRKILAGKAPHEIAA